MIKKYLLVLVLFCFLNCVRVIQYDVDKAIESCNGFIRAIIEEDYDNAYDCVSDKLKSLKTKRRFIADLKNSRKNRGDFNKAIFDSYAYVLNQRALELFYIINHDIVGEVVYHFVLEGDSRTDYELFFIDIGNNVNYPENMKYIKAFPRLKLDRKIEVTGE